MHRIMGTMVILGVALAAAFGVMPVPVTAQSSTPVGDQDAAANEALVRRYFEIASAGDLDTLDEVVSPDLVIHTAPPGEGTSLETLRETLAAARVGLPDFAFRIDDLFTEGNLVVVRTTISGTHLGNFFGAPPTGNRFETSAIDIWQVEKGKLVANWHLEDILGVMEQIAAVSGAGDTATPRPMQAAATPTQVEAAQSAATPDAATINANVALAQRFHDEIFERGNLDVADEILAPGFVWHSDVPPGPEGVKTFASAVRTAFPDLTLAADKVIADGDRVAILWTLAGPHQGEFLGVPATGKSVATPGVDIYRIENGQIAELWTVGDELGLLIQLGAFPTFWAEPAATPGM